MDLLKELVYVVNRNKVKQIELLDLDQDPPSKVNRLYQAISTGKVKTDEDARILLYESGKPSNAYTNLKGRLRSKLLDTLFFIDTNQAKQTDRRIAIHEVSKSLAAAQLLLSKGGRRAAIKEFDKLLKIADEFEFNHIALTAARVLREHYGSQEIDQKKYAAYSELSRKYQEIDFWEDRAEMYYTNIVTGFNNQQQDRRELQQLCIAYYEELVEVEDKVTSYKFAFHQALIRLMQYTIINDYKGAIPVSEELLKSFSNKTFATNTAIQNFLHHQIIGYLQDKDFTKGLEAGKKSQGLAQEGTNNWFKHQEFHFMLAMQTGMYQEAYEVYIQTTHHSQYLLLQDESRETWTLFHAYLAFLRKHGKIELSEDSLPFPEFRSQSFTNKMPIYTRDKEGKNVAILIIQILYLISHRKKNDAIERIEGMKKYCMRYLSTEDSRRAYYFLQLLLTIPSGGFKIERIKNLAAKPLSALYKLPSTSSNLFGRMEVIPYEVLWGMVMDDLRR